MKGGLVLNTIIRQIIDADKQARERVEQAKAERQKARNLIADEKDDVQKKFKAEVEEKLEAKRAELKRDFESEVALSQKEYAASLAALETLYDEKKDEWIESIVKTCLSN